MLLEFRMRIQNCLRLFTGERLMGRRLYGNNPSIFSWNCHLALLVYVMLQRFDSFKFVITQVTSMRLDLEIMLSNVSLETGHVRDNERSFSRILGTG